MNTETIEVVGFDLGETLLFYRDTPLSWASLYEPALARVAAACRLEPSRAEIAAACEILRQHNTRLVPRETEIGAESIFGTVLAAWHSPASESLLTTVTQSFFGFFQQRMSAYPDTHAVLATLSARGLALGILTDVPYGMPAACVRDDLRAAGIEDFFASVLTSVEVGWRKPTPTGFGLLARRLGTSPERMLFVGNEAKDVLGARQAGAQAVLLDHGQTGADHGQGATIQCLNDLLPLLD